MQEVLEMYKQNCGGDVSLALAMLNLEKSVEPITSAQCTESS